MLEALDPPGLAFGRLFSRLAGFNIHKIFTEGGGGEASLASDAVTWMAGLNGTFNLSPTTSLQAHYFYRAPMDIERGRFSSFHRPTVRQRFHGTSMLLRVSDLFNIPGFSGEAGDDNIVRLTERLWSSRAVQLSLQYTFGQVPRSRPRPTPGRARGAIMRLLAFPEPQSPLGWLRRR